MSPARQRLRAFLRNPSFLIGAALLLAILVLALAAPLLYPADPLDMVGSPTLWPGEDPEFPLGTDSLGRDLAAGLAYGARASLLVGFSAAGIGLAIGIVVGATAGYLGGWADNLLLRLTELFQAVPGFLLVIVLVAIGEPRLGVIAPAIGIASWPVAARLARAQFRSLREADFVQAARASGSSDLAIAIRHILPNAMPPLVVTGSIMVANAILIEAGLSFLNLGDPNLVSWGSMMGEGRQLLRTEWYVSALPGVAIAVTVLAVNLVGDGLNEVLNPRNGT